MTPNAPASPHRAEPCILTIFGATGDLTMRKLLPAIYNLTRDGLLHENTVVVGFARRPKTDDEFRKEMLDGVQKFSRTKPVDPGIWQKVAAKLFYHQSTFEDPAGYASLAKRFAELDKQFNTGGRRMYYLSTSPSEFAPIIQHLGNLDECAVREHRLSGRTGLCDPPSRPTTVRQASPEPSGPRFEARRPHVRHSASLASPGNGRGQFAYGCLANYSAALATRNVMCVRPIDRL